jgi:drug/metabolite transporter (DMT)-like permease
MRHRIQLLAAAALFSTGGAAIKACSLTSWQVAGLRSGIAALVLLLVPAARRGWTPRAWLVGAAYAATVVLFVQANKLTTSAATAFLQSTAPLYVLLLAPHLLGERAIGLAYVLVTAAIRRVPALDASLLMLAEPAVLDGRAPASRPAG